MPLRSPANPSMGTPDVFDDLAAFNQLPKGDQAKAFRNLSTAQRQRIKNRADYGARVSMRHQGYRAQNQLIRERRQETWTQAALRDAEREKLRQARQGQDRSYRVQEYQRRLDERRREAQRRINQRNQTNLMKAGIRAGSGLTGRLLGTLGQAGQRAATMPAPGGIGALVFAIIVCLMILIPVNKDNRTRADLMFGVLLGTDDLGAGPDTSINSAALNNGDNAAANAALQGAGQGALLGPDANTSGFIAPAGNGFAPNGAPNQSAVTPWFPGQVVQPGIPQVPL